MAWCYGRGLVCGSVWSKEVNTVLKNIVTVRLLINFSKEEKHDSSFLLVDYIVYERVPGVKLFNILFYLGYSLHMLALVATYVVTMLLAKL